MPKDYLTFSKIDTKNVISAGVIKQFYKYKAFPVNSEGFFFFCFYFY